MILDANNRAVLNNRGRAEEHQTSLSEEEAGGQVLENRQKPRENGAQRPQLRL
jgi:hypothetical protein